MSRSEVLFAISDDAATAAAVEQIVERYGIRTRWDFQRVLRELTNAKLSDLDENLLYFDPREAPLADMYELLCKI